MKKTILFALILSGILLRSLAQAQTVDPSLNFPVKLPTSPNTSSLIKYAESNVDLSTGANPFSIPIYNIETNGFNLAIKLNNSGSPNKPNEIAPPCGTGWSLFAGGVISVTDMNGLNKNINANLIESGLSSSFLDSIVVPSSDYVTKKISYNFGNYSGVFFENGNDFKHLGDPKLKVQKLSFKEYKITNEDGIEFYFGGSENFIERSIKTLGPFNLDVPMSDLISHNVSSNSDANLMYTTISENYYEDLTANSDTTISSQRTITSLYLREIRFPNTSDKLSFIYESVIGPEIYTLLEEYSYKPDDANADQNQEYIHRSFQISRASNLSLTSIKWPNGKIDFTYQGREDNIGYYYEYSNNIIKEIKIGAPSGYLKKIAKFEIKNSKNELIKGFDLDYFYSTSSSVLEKRLYLNSVTEYNSIEKYPPTKFSYFNTEMNPSILTNALDYWGNYKKTISMKSKIPQMEFQTGAWNQNLTNFTIDGYINNLQLDPKSKPGMFTLVHYYGSASGAVFNHNDRSSDAGIMFGMLERVQYPTGGVDSFVYSLDTLAYRYGNENKVIIGAGVKITKVIRKFNNSLEDLVKTYSYNGGELLYVPQFVRSYFLAAPYSTFKISDAYYGIPLNTPNGNVVNFRKVTEHITGIGKNVYFFAYNKIDCENCSSQTDSFKSSNSISASRVRYFGMHGGNYTQCSKHLDYFPFLPSTDFSWLNNVLTKVLSYDNLGALVQETTNEYILVKKACKVRNLAILNDVVKQRATQALSFEQDGVVQVSEYEYASGWAGLTNSQTKTYSATSVVQSLTESKEIQYNNMRQVISETITNSDGTKSITETKYVPDFFLDENTNLNYILSGNQAVDGLKSLYNLNILSPSIISTRYIQKSGDTKKMLASYLTLYKNYNEHVLPWMELSFNSKTPISNFSPYTVDSNLSTLSFDSRYKWYRTYTKYNAKNKILELLDKNKGLVSYKWGYNENLLEAEIVNGKNSNNVMGDNTSYLGFEAGSINSNVNILDNNDYWTFNANTEIATESFTGKYSLKCNSASNVSFYKSFTPTSNSRRLFISGWIKIANSTTLGNSAKVNAEIEIKNGNNTVKIVSIETNNDPNSWNFFTAFVDAPLNSGNYTFNFKYSGNTNIALLVDDVRVFPENSNFTTYIYDEVLEQPLSISDNNNKPNHFEYDGSGRLLSILDFKKDFVKTNVYLFKQK